MDLDELQSFACVVRFGGFSAAERATGETRSKLSKAVARLEQELGTQLLERTTRSVRVTDAGAAIYRQCKIIEDSLDETRAIAARTRGDVSGVLRVSCPPGLARHLGAETLTSFLRLYPLVRVQMDLVSRRVDLIGEGYDVAFRLDVQQDTDLSLVMRQLGRSRRVLVASPALLATLPDLDVAVIPDLPTLTIGDHVEQERWSLINDLGERRRIAHRPRLCSNDSTLVRDGALAGLGIALLHEQMCAADIAAGRLIHVLPGWHTMDGLVHMIFAAREGMSAAKRAFVDHYAAQSFFPHS